MIGISGWGRSGRRGRRKQKKAEPMDKLPLYSIGHGNRKQEELLELLQRYGIQYLLDVRTSPYSKFNPQFNQNELKHFLLQNGTIYVFMGDTLGGRPEDESCYTDGKVDYEKIKTKDFFKIGIDRLKTAYKKNIPIVMMCSESKPQECHRSKLIGTYLQNEDIRVIHIDEKGKEKNQDDVMLLVTKGKNAVDLFGEKESFVSRKAYKKDENVD